MTSIYNLKPRFQNLLRPPCRALARAGVTANQVTVAAAILSIAAGAAIYLNPTHPRILLLLPVVLFVRMALNAIDGMLAREFNQKSRLGAILNELGDVVSDTALYLPLAIVPGFDPRLVILIVIGAIISEMTGVVAVQIGASRRYDGPMGKSDRAFVIGAIGLLIGVGVRPMPWLAYVLWAIIAFLAVTILRRAKSSLRAGPSQI